MSRGIIYLITNKENGLRYVGSTLQPMNKEWQSHIQSANRMSSEPLHKAFRKYGVHRFNIQELDECDEKELDERREHWIRHYNTYDGENYNFRSFEEEEDNEDDMIPIIKENTVQPHQIKHLRSFTDEDRKKINHNGHKVQGICIETGEIKVWDSAAKAAQEVTGNIRKNSNIITCARNCYNCYGYKWSIIEEKNKLRPIIGINKKTGRIGPRYDSVRQGMIALGGNSLLKSLKNPGRYSYRGFYWYYI